MRCKVGTATSFSTVVLFCMFHMIDWYVADADCIEFEENFCKHC